MSWSRLQPVAAGLVVSAVILMVMPDALVGVFYDDGIYLALARSLAEGHGYHLPFLPGSPAAVHYPFGYPAFLAALWTLWPVFPDNVALFRGANAVLMGAGTALMIGHFAPRVAAPRWITAAAVVIAATAVPMVAVATVLFSEPLFLALTAGALWAADSALRRERGEALRLAVLAGVLAGTAALTRSIGVTVIGGMVLAFAVRRRWKDAAAAAIPAALLLAPWMLWSRAHSAVVDPLIASNYGTYGDFLTQGGAVLSLTSLFEVARPLGAIALPPVPGVLRIVLGLIAIGVLLAGFVALTRAAPAAGWMLWCYIAIVAVWPYAPDRFLWGVLPFLAIALVAGVKWSLELGAWNLDKTGNAAVQAPSSKFQVLRLAGALAALTVTVGFGISQVRGFSRGTATSTQLGISATMNEILPWIRTDTDSAAVIAGEDEALIWLYTGRRAVPSFLWRVRGRAGESFGPDSLHSWIEKSGATHLVLTGPGSEAAPTVDALLALKPGYLQLIRVWPGQLLAFRVHRGT